MQSKLQKSPEYLGSEALSASSDERTSKSIPAIKVSEISVSSTELSGSVEEKKENAADNSNSALPGAHSVLTGSEFSASEVRKVLQQLFPHRRLVLSQFTFFNQIGIARPTGNTSRRGRQCYILEDMLPIALVLALKEEGIPFKNIEVVPDLIREKASRIFNLGPGSRVSGQGETISLHLSDEVAENAPALEELLSEGSVKFFWSFDVGILATQLQAVVEIYLRDIQQGQDSLAA